MNFPWPLPLPHGCEAEFYLHGENALFVMEGAKEYILLQNLSGLILSE